MESNKKIILTVCRDSGAANAFSFFIKNWDIDEIDLYNLCIGEAAKIFESNGVEIHKNYRTDISLEEIKRLFDNINPVAVLLGSSLDSWTERSVCLEAKKRNIFSLGYVDWWSNFGSRFSTPKTNDLSYLPDQIAVVDEDAKNGCTSDAIPEDILRKVGNPYWDHLANVKDSILKAGQDVRKILGIPANNKVVLVISSIIRHLDLDLGFDENDLWKNVSPLPLKSETGTSLSWTVKPHPKEDIKDLKQILKEHQADIQILENFSSLEAVAAADYVIGMCSSLLFEAAVLGKKIVSFMPGLKEGKLKYFRIFDHLGIPQITKASESGQIIKFLATEKLTSPRLDNIPFPCGEKTASCRLRDLLLNAVK